MTAKFMLCEGLPLLRDVAHDAIAVERRFETEQREEDREWLLPLHEAGGNTLEDLCTPGEGIVGAV